MLHPQRQFASHKIGNTGHKESPEKPEGTSQKLVITRHRTKDVPKILLHLMPAVGMGHTTSDIAESLVEHPQPEHPIMEQQKKYRPKHKRDIQTADALLDISCLVAKIA